MPTGHPMEDGHSTTITLASAPNILLWEKEVTPPGMSAGGKVDQTTMHNDRYRTSAPKKLITTDDMAFTAAYKPASLVDIIAQMGIEQLVTINFPDGETWENYGWIDEFKPNAHKEGEQPTASCKIIFGNRNASKVETAPSYSA